LRLVSARTLNQGSEQDMLDNLSGVRVEVTALKPSHATPHLELLCYRTTTKDLVSARCRNCTPCSSGARRIKC
jgi:hypothetical protein